MENLSNLIQRIAITEARGVVQALAITESRGRQQALSESTQSMNNADYLRIREIERKGITLQRTPKPKKRKSVFNSRRRR